MTNLNNPLIIQSDKTVLLEVENPNYEECRDQLARFAELVKSPEHVHTYRITPLSLWNAAAAGMTAEQITGALQRFSKYDLPGNVRVDVADYVTRYGKVKLLKRDGNLLLVSTDALLLTEISRNKRIAPLLRGQVDGNTLLVDPQARGHIKHALVDFGFPAEDLARCSLARKEGKFSARALAPATTCSVVLVGLGVGVANAACVGAGVTSAA
jgi:DNA excision repair protein ERCC-3